MKLFAQVAIIAILLIGLLASQPAFAKTLKACGHPFYPPVSWVNNSSLLGLAPAVTEQLFSELQYEVTFIADYNWKRCLLEVKQGNADIVVAAYRIPSREDYLYFSTQPIIADTIALFENAEKPLQFTQLKDLENKTVGLLLGDSFGETFDRFLLKNTTIEYVSRNRQNFEKLSMGRIDFMPIGRLSGILQSQKLGFDQQISPLNYTVDTEFYFLALGHASKLEKHLPFLNQRLQEMQENGTIKKLTEQYSQIYLSQP